MAVRRLVLTEQQRSTRLDEEIAEWSQRGYRIVSRSSTTAQLSKPKASMIVPLLVVLFFSALVWLFSREFIYGAAALIAGCLLLLLLYAATKEKLVYLSVDTEGSITER